MGSLGEDGTVRAANELIERLNDWVLVNASPRDSYRILAKLEMARLGFPDMKEQALDDIKATIAVHGRGADALAKIYGAVKAQQVFASSMPFDAPRRPEA